MILDDFERLNRGFYRFFCNFGLRDIFQERIALKPIEIDIDKLSMKFLALNLDFDGLKSRFSRFKETCTQGLQRAVPL